MNIFKAVKEAVSCRDAASFYGIKVGGSGLCHCPFHNDNTPSMKVDIRYYCFGCGETGDVIDFIGKLYSLRPYDAAKKIADDFRITDYDTTNNYSGTNSSLVPSSDNPNKSSPNPHIIQHNNEYQLKRALDLYIRDTLFSLHQYREKLRTFRQSYAPKSIEELDQCNPLFEEALMYMDKIDWMIDELTFGHRDDQITFIKNYKGEIEHVKYRLTEIN